MERLYTLFSEVLEDTEFILKRTGDAENPLAVLFRTVLREQKAMIEQLLPHLEQNNQQLEDYKTPLSIVYQDDSISDSTFRAWGRAIVWQDETNSKIVQDLHLFFQKMKKNLKEAGAELKSTFGEEKVKYVVPSFYLSQKGQEGKG